VTRPAKLALASAATVAVLALLALAALLVVVRTGWFRGQVHARIVREIEEATGGRVEIGSFSFDPSSLRARVGPLVLHGTEPPEAAPLLRVHSVEVGLKLISLWRRDVDIQSLRFDAPQINVIVFADGRTNLPTPKIARRPHQPPLAEFLDLAVGRFEVWNGTLAWASHKIPLEMRGEDLRTRLFYEAAGPRYRGDLALRGVRLSTFADAFDLAAEGAVERNRLSIARAHIAWGGSQMTLAGGIENLESPRADVSVDARLALPSTLRGTALLGGRLTATGPDDYHFTGSVDASGVAIAKVTGLRVRAALEAVPDQIRLRNLQAASGAARFAGSVDLDHLRRFRLEGNLRGLPLRQLIDSPWSASLGGPVHVEGSLAGANVRDAVLKANLDLTAAGGGTPLSGALRVNFDQAAGHLEIAPSALSTPFSHLELSGNPSGRLQVRLESRNFDDLTPALSMLQLGRHLTIPAKLENGLAVFDGTVTGGLRSPQVAGHLALSNLATAYGKLDSAAADITLSDADVRLRNLHLSAQGAAASGEIQARLRNWMPSAAEPVSASLRVRNADATRILRLLGASAPLQGALSGNLHLAGSAAAPALDGEITLEKGRAWEQPFDRLHARLAYHNRVLEVSSASLALGRARLEFTAHYTHSERDFRAGDLRFNLSGNSLPLASLDAVSAEAPGLDGRLALKFQGEAWLAATSLRLRSLSGAASFRELTYQGSRLGGLDVLTSTEGTSLRASLRAGVAGSRITGEGSWRLDGDYAGSGELRFSRLSLSMLRARWNPERTNPDFPVEAFAEGKVNFQGRSLDLDGYRAAVEIPLVEIKPLTKDPASKLEELGLHSAEPIRAQFDGQSLRIDKARLVGRDTNLDISGRILFRPSPAFDLRFRGGIDMAILHDFERDLSASGVSTIDATLRGPLTNPGVYGRLLLRNASLAFAGVPNGIDQAGGAIYFDRNRATIERLTAQTGGGRLTLGGFIGFGGPELVYRLQAAVEQVRFRYPEGVSTTVNASVNLSGTTARSLLSGVVTVLGSRVNAKLDFASLLTQSSQPLVTPAIQNELLRGMQFDLRVQTASNARLETSLTRDITVESNLRLRGSPAKPILLGRLTATQGEMNFFGTKYTISRGEINFLNPIKLEPVVNMDLETRVRGVDVTISFTGPPNKLNVSYRSDPALQVQEIVALLTVGRTPSSSSPAMAARQSQTSGDWQQSGAGTLLGQALSAPMTGRLQRFFGVSRIKIDPQLRGLDNNPQARLTIEQQVSKDVTITYITNLNSEQRQLFGLEWNLNRQWSVLATREENGLFGIEFLYRKQFK
jgi:translocation and assembly module TamB